MPLRTPRDTEGKFQELSLTMRAWKHLWNCHLYHSWNINSLWCSDAICWLRSGSTLAQVMACCLMAPSHYLNQCWLHNVLWHSPGSNFTRSSQATILYNVIEHYTCKITSTSPRGQWVNGPTTHASPPPTHTQTYTHLLLNNIHNRNLSKKCPNATYYTPDEIIWYMPCLYQSGSCAKRPPLMLALNVRWSLA